MLTDHGRCWFEARDCTAAAGRSMLFLDRDGVILVDPGYLADPAGVELVPGAAELVGDANRAGIAVVVVTNQSGIGRGLYGWSDFAAVNLAMEACLARSGASIDAIIACACHPDGLGSFRHAAHPWRKPAPGMLHAAAKHYQADLARSWLVGDQVTDIAAAHAAGCRGAFLLGDGQQNREREFFSMRAGFDLRMISALEQVVYGDLFDQAPCDHSNGAPS